ncbi:DUF6348 family protein [Plantactinospora solaniradicis]|uniref:DUF6348 family protein n=1 Tax=Plantactinospora solaniradicis TaxID=1723736 RepID=A0ABW1K2R8_9ACTN
MTPVGKWPRNGPDGDVQSGRTAEVLKIVAERLDAFGPDWTATVDGSRLTGAGSWAVALRDNHTDHDEHLDLDFVLNVDRPAETTISDCVTGYGATARDAWQQGVGIWATLTAAVVVELMRPANEFADHYHGNDPGGFLGWHTISAGFIGFGRGEPGALAGWATDNSLIPQLSSVISGGLDRGHLNGVKILFGGVAGAEVAEVRINGREHPESGKALLALPWPRPSEPVFAKTFALLVHPETDACGQS